MKRLLLVPICALVSVLAALSLSVTALAQERAAGQVDLSALAEPFGSRPKVNINFGSAMMNGFAETLRSRNPEAAEVLATIAGLRVMVFEDVDTSLAEASVAEVAARLSGDGWTPALEVRDENAKVDLFLIESGPFVKGLTVLVREAGGTAVFANVHGDLDPAVIGKLIARGNALGGMDFGDIMGQFGQGATDAAPAKADGPAAR
ncbi:MAG: hypothetical protein CVV18_00825 [Gammaproteobacteria bacterium HGW-Gammaproteobacteria-8]|nr:MAG: hypothetical protein CVV18_00825 [Gammaproteobacteria bacterium HGW-Gammaproteobacteria-8]